MDELVFTEADKVDGIGDVLGRDNIFVQEVLCVWSCGAVGQVLIHVEAEDRYILKLSGQVECRDGHIPHPIFCGDPHVVIVIDSIVIFQALDDRHKWPEHGADIVDRFPCKEVNLDG